MSSDELYVDESSQLFEHDPSEESEEDLLSNAPEPASAVVTSTDWTVETVLRQLERGNIELNPRFQRRDAWTQERKSRFIESLFLGLPVPQLVLAERTDQRGAFIVIDGKQRLLALRQFEAGGQPETGNGFNESEFKTLSLSRLEVLSDFNGLSLSQVGELADGGTWLTAFENQTIRTVVVRNWPDDDFLYRVFLRLNTGSLPLSPQELRQALIPGPFMDFCDEASSNSSAIQKVLGVNRPDFRMRDVELLIRFLAFSLYLSTYDGNLKRFLDLTCKSLNSEWAAREDQIRSAAGECDFAIETAYEVFGRDAFRRWNGTSFEGRFNRAVFDVLAYYFSDSAIAKESKERNEEVVEAFKIVSTITEFSDSVTRTTKSIDATFTRLSLWGDALRRLLAADVPNLQIHDNRIRSSSEQ